MFKQYIPTHKAHLISRRKYEKHSVFNFLLCISNCLRAIQTTRYPLYYTLWSITSYRFPSRVCLRVNPVASNARAKVCVLTPRRA